MTRVRAGCFGWNGFASICSIRIRSRGGLFVKGHVTKSRGAADWLSSQLFNPITKRRRGRLPAFGRLDGVRALVADRDDGVELRPA
jgi:hypothetical protein